MNYLETVGRNAKKAFENLNNQGIKAYMNCGWERKESLDIITGDNYDGEWIFFHEQNYENST